MAETDQFKTILTKAMQICSRKELCASDVETKLESCGTAKVDAHKILNILLKENFINEERYAKAFVRIVLNWSVSAIFHSFYKPVFTVDVFN